MQNITMALLTTLSVTIASVSRAESISIAASQSATPPEMEQTLTNEINSAIDRALDWLAARQREDGTWSNRQFPALTALPVWSFIRSEHPQRNNIIQSAVQSLLDTVQPDGGIYREVVGRRGGGLSNYNTAIAMTVLHALGDPALAPIILNARTFVAQGQLTGDDVYHGGFGYDVRSQQPYADIMNTLQVLEALRYTADIEEERPAGQARAQVDWEAAAAFVSRLQNPPEAGEEHAGGFSYNPAESKAGEDVQEDGSVIFRSYGSMTYSGLLALIYAGVDRNDPRVRSAFDWASRHWTLEENPGMGAQGYFFFLNVLSRALNAYGAEWIPVSQEQLLNWRREAALRLVRMQRIEAETGHGFWTNDDGRFWENDPILVTAYSILALQTIAVE
ncbi:MAG: prenyltransferase/squalene oxidase repeat-containing protein [Kiritimatiellia bacterium]